MQLLVSPMRDSTFTQDILTQILKRLPAKSLVRFRCVSKFFCSIITDPLFADLHRNWSLTLPGRTSIFVSLGPLLIHDVYYTINYNEEENHGNLRANRVLYLDRKHWKYTRLESSANGLLCLSDLSENNDNVVCNLSTRKHTLLPRISLLHYHQRSSRTRVGFDPISKRYKVLKSGVGQDHLGNTTWKLWVLTLGVDTSWREFNCIDFYFPTEAFHLSYSGTSVYIDGVIYWSDLVPGFDIVAFDVGTENLRTISFPDDYSPISFPKDYSPLADVDGRLAIIQVSRVDTLYLQYYIEIWSLDKSMKWGKCRTIPIPWEVDQMVYKRILHLTTSHFGEIVLLIVTPEYVHVLLYELGRNVWRMFKKCGRDAFGISNLYIKSVHIIPENMFFP